MIRVLIVDDDEVILNAYKRLFDEFCVDVEANVDAALSFLRTHEVDVVLCDFSLHDRGGRDGIWLLEQVEERHPWVRRILISGATRSAIGERLGSPGGQTFMCKPVSRAELLVALQGR